MKNKSFTAMAVKFHSASYDKWVRKSYFENYEIKKIIITFCEVIFYWGLIINTQLSKK